MIELKIAPEALQPIVTQVAAAVLAEFRADGAKLAGDKIAYTEAHAAALLDVEPHVLRDARNRGEIEACKVGKRIAYTREALLDYLARNRWQPK